MPCRELPKKHTVALAEVRRALAMRKHGWCAKFSSYACSIGFADIRHSVWVRGEKPKSG